jgi:hypothetical protein
MCGGVDVQLHVLLTSALYVDVEAKPHFLHTSRFAAVQSLSVIALDPTWSKAFKSEDRAVGT